MTSKFRDEAIQLISVVEDKFKVNPEALEFLREVEAPMAVIGVAGAYRSGKSYLLNKIVLNTSKGFDIGSTINACTKGIWVWGRPVKAETDDGTIVNMIVMDSEGLGSLEADASHDSRIFALILLLSSTFVYNSTGAIDENSLSQLSVVINITKHISVRATKPRHRSGQTSLTDVDSEEKNTQAPQTEATEDPDDYSKHFPDFLWVLRDFALQMVDEYGDELTPNQYLENALQFDDQIASTNQKNKIRELIRAFFSNRRCFSLVRPVINEADLGRLNTLQLNNLRAEFVEGALRVKNALYQSARIKKVNERSIGGAILGGMLESYVSTMNKGVVPNIENTWYYVTQKQASELMAAAIEKYQRNGKEQAKRAIPTSKAELSALLATARTEALGSFRSTSLLNAQEQKEYLRLIATRLEQEERQLFAENDNEFEKLLESAMNSNYKESIYTPVLHESVRTASEVISLFNSLKTNFEASEPNGPRKHFRINRFLFGRLSEIFAIFTRNAETRFTDQQEEQSRDFAERTQQLQEELSQLESLRTELQNRNEEMNAKMTATALESSKLEETVRFLTGELERVQSEFEKSKQEDRVNARKKAEELNSRLEEAKTQLRNSEALQNQLKSDFELQMSLLNQRIEFHENREKELMEQKGKLIARQRELEDGFEEKLRRLREEFEEKVNEKVGELSLFKEQQSLLEEELSGLRELNCSFQKEFGNKDTDWQNVVDTHIAQAESLRERVAELENHANTLTDEKQALSETLSQLGAEHSSQDKLLREAIEKHRLTSADMEKKLELSQQQNEFLQLRIDELEADAQEAKRMRELSTQNIQKTTTILKSDVSAQLQDLKNNFETKLARLTKDHEVEKDELLQQLNSQSEEMEGRLATLKEEKDKLTHVKLELTQSVESWQGRAKLAEERLSALEKSQSESVKIQISGLEQKLKHALESRDTLLAEKEEEGLVAKQMLEGHLANMRIVYENEKAILEKRLSEEKTQRETLIKESLEELMLRKESEVQQLDEEIEMLKGELSCLEVRNKAVVAKLIADNGDLRNKAESGERRALEAVNSLQKRHSEETGKLKSQLAAIESEKRLSDERLASLKAELSVKNMESFKLEQTVSALQASINKLNIERERMNEDSLHELAELRNRLEKCESEKFQLSEELIGSRVSHTKDLALKNQKIEFIEGKINELSSLNENTQRDCDERVRAVTFKISAELEELRSKMSSENEQWTLKYEEKKRQLKDNEMTAAAKIAELEKARIVLTERNTFLENKKAETEENYKREINRLERESRCSVESSSADRNQLSIEVEQLRKDRHELDSKLGELTAKIDKERAIHEAKVNFLEQQTRKLKSDLAESQNNFDSVFQNFQQFRASDKEETENSHANFIMSIEERYSAQIQDLKDQNRSQSESFKQKIKVLEKEVRRLESVNEETVTHRFEMNMQHEKRVNELLLNERTLTGELEKLRENLAKAVLDGQREAEVRAEGLQKRIGELESKLKAVENEKSLLAFKQEKMKTNWNIEKDMMLSNKTDLLEKIDRVKKQNEFLSRENDKLKTDLKMVKKNNIMNSIMNLNTTTQSKLSTGFENPLRDITDSTSNLDELGKY